MFAAYIKGKKKASWDAHLENDQNYTGAYAACGGATGPSGDLWQTQPDCGTVGTKTGSTSIVASPVYGPQPDSRQFTMTFDTSGGGVRWFDAKATSETAAHFQYDAYINIADVSKVMNIELDINHSVLTPSPLVYILASQCNLLVGLWQVTNNGAWVNTNVPCTPSQVASGVWAPLPGQGPSRHQRKHRDLLRCRRPGWACKSHYPSAQMHRRARRSPAKAQR